jgi:hypothetical protein
MKKYKEESLSNAAFAAQDQSFRRLCVKSKVEPTARQASKFRNRMGKAFNSQTMIVRREDILPKGGS